MQNNISILAFRLIQAALECHYTSMHFETYNLKDIQPQN